MEVVVPPLHHQLVTATVKAGETRARSPQGAGGARARARPAGAAVRADARRASAITVAWGLPYFRRFVPKLADEHVPVDLRATKTLHKPVRVLQDAIRFPSDPPETILEANDVAVLLRSDSARPHRRRGEGALHRSRRVPGDEHPQGLRGRRLRRRPEPAEADGGRRAGAGLVPDPRPGRALPRLHLDAEGGARAAEDRQHRGARVQPGRLLRPGDAPGRSRTSPRTSRPGTSTSRTRSGSRPSSGRGSTSVRTCSPSPRGRRTSPTRPASGATSGGRSRSATRRRSRPPRGWRRRRSGRAAPSTAPARRSRTGPTSTRSTTRSSGARTRSATGCATAGRRRPLRRLQPVERRLQPRPAGDGRRPPGRDEAPLRPARPRPGLQLDPAHHPPAELPRPAARATARSRSSSCSPEPVDKNSHSCSSPGLRDWVANVTSANPV